MNVNLRFIRGRAPVNQRLVLADQEINELRQQVDHVLVLLLLVIDLLYQFDVLLLNVIQLILRFHLLALVLHDPLLQKLGQIRLAEVPVAELHLAAPFGRLHVRAVPVLVLYLLLKNFDLAFILLDDALAEM